MKFREKKIEKCWVGETQKTCYATREEAEVAAEVAAHDYGAPELTVYKCEFGDHWHLSSKNGKSHIVSCIFLMLMATILVIGVLNREFLWDYYRALSYVPSSEMVEIREKIELTENGEFIFNVSQPVLDDRDNFNEHCKAVIGETAVLGCYTNDTIYVYNIDSAELAGIREVTVAHELLHAVYAQMDEAEKANLQSSLEQVYKSNTAILEDDLSLYSEAEREEEIYVRVGTEIANLPENLEQHYATIFENQDKIVAYYNSYDAVFKNLKAELNSLTAEIESLSEQIESQKATYEAQVAQLTNEVAEFNNCAQTAGCFSEAEFYSRRAELLNWQGALENSYNEITNLINTYNVKIDAYNAGVLQGQKLNAMINSNSKPSEVGI